MRKHFLLILMIPIFATAQESEVKSVIDNFFAAFHARDTVGLRQSLSSKAIFQSISENGNDSILKEDNISDFLTSIAGIPPTMKFEEQLISYEFKIDGSMAHAWTPYVFYINGKRSHSGVNSFHLQKENGRWKIIHLVDTRRK